MTLPSCPPSVDNQPQAIDFGMEDAEERLRLAQDLDRQRAITPAEWARAAGYTPQLIADFRNHGKNITIQALLKLTAAIGVDIVFIPRDSLDPLSFLSPQQRLVLETMERMPPEDATRIAGVTRALATTEGLARDLLVEQLDGIVKATRKSSGPEPDPTLNALPGPARPRAREENPVVMQAPTKQRGRRLQ